MAYLKPNWFERNIFKHLAMKSGLMGTNTLLVPGRSSGRPQRVPVIPVEHGGARAAGQRFDQRRVNGRE